MTTKLSRRSAIAALAASTAAATAAGASEPLAGNPDAELLALGIELEDVIRDAIPEIRRDIQSLADYEARCERAGFPRLEPTDFASSDEYREYMETRHTAGHVDRDDDDLDEHGASITWNKISDRMYPLAEEIMTHRPQTVAGLAVLCRAISLVERDYWDGHDEERTTVPFIEAVCAFAGVRSVNSEIEGDDA